MGILSREEAERRGLNAARGIVIAVSASALLWAILIALILA